MANKEETEVNQAIENLHSRDGVKMMTDVNTLIVKKKGEVCNIAPPQVINLHIFAFPNLHIYLYQKLVNLLSCV
jgi:hypothetical protein